MREKDFKNPTKIKELDYDRYQEAFEPFLEFSNPVNAREYKIAESIKPSNGPIIQRGIIGLKGEYLDVKSKKQEKPKLLQGRTSTNLAGRR